MNTKPLIATAATALTLALAPTAFGQDYCVASATCVTGGGTAEPSVQAALAAADTTAALDRVLIGPGTYSAPNAFGSYNLVNPVQVVGSGSGSTILTGPAADPAVLYLGPGSSVSDLGAVIPTDCWLGLDLADAIAKRVKVTAVPASPPNAEGVSAWDGTAIEDSEIDLTMMAATSIGVGAATNTSIRRSVIAAYKGIAAQGTHVQVDRDVVKAKSMGLSAAATNVEVTNSLIQLTGSTTGVVATTGNGTDANIALRGDTIIGDGTPGSLGVLSYSNTPHTAAVSVDSSIVRGFPISLDRHATGAGATANLSVQYSDVDTAAVESSGAGTLSLGPGNINADPLFAGAPDFQLLAGSPALDAGNPADLGDTTDLVGNPRVIDRDGDGIARRDMGALEAAVPQVDPPPAGGAAPLDSPSQASSGSSSGADPGSPDPGSALKRSDRTAPALTALSVRKARLSFRLSERALLRVDILRRSNDARLHRIGGVSRVFERGAAKLSLRRVGGKALRPGSYVAKLSASDAAGNRSRTYSARFKLAR